MENQYKLVSFLKRNYKPVAIILHGSRATGKYKKHSDWDFYLLVEHHQRQKMFRALVGGENIEFILLSPPMDYNRHIESVGPNLQGAKVVFDTDSRGKRFIEYARNIYKQGYPYSKVKTFQAKLYLLSVIGGMTDYLCDQGVFLRHLSKFYMRSVDLWFQLCQHEYSKPFYEALPIIRKKDPGFYNQLSILWSSHCGNEEKVKAAKTIMKMLFKK